LGLLNSSSKAFVISFADRPKAKMSNGQRKKTKKEKEEEEEKDICSS
jgi:hypothetical protein